MREDRESHINGVIFCIRALGHSENQLLIGLQCHCQANKTSKGKKDLPTIKITRSHWKMIADNDNNSLLSNEFFISFLRITKILESQ